MQASNALGRFDVDRVLVAECAPLHSDDETELFDVLRQVGEGKARLLALVPVDQLQRFESRRAVGNGGGRSSGSASK